jgi:hypothetical protein
MHGIKLISSACGFLAFSLAFAYPAGAGTTSLAIPNDRLEPAQTASKSLLFAKREIRPKPCFVLQAKIVAVEKQFEHESFNMHSVVKASVFAFKPGDDLHKIGYERLWFHDGKAIGVEKRNILDVKSGSAIAIRVIQSPSPTIEETKASANVVLRLVLDTLIHKNEVAGVTVPANTFSAISQELQFRNGHLLPEGQEPPKEAHVSFQLNGEASNLKQTFYWI